MKRFVASRVAFLVPARSVVPKTLLTPRGEWW
jgi:hypothetical protein